MSRPYSSTRTVAAKSSPGAVGGTYLVLPSGQPTGLAPLRALTQSPGDSEFLIAWVTNLITAGGYRVTPDDSRRIAQGVTALLRLAPQHRSLSELRAFLGQRDAAGAGAHLERWCRGGALGWAFDGEEDRVRLDAPFLGFDMTALLDDAGCARAGDGVSLPSRGGVGGRPPARCRH